MRKIMKLLENLGPHDPPYVPGSGSDPAVKWRNGSNGSLIRKPGDSVRWKVVKQGQDWVIQKIDREDGQDVPDGYGRGDHLPRGSLMTLPEWRAATGRYSPRFAEVRQDGILRFPERDDAEIALQTYERGMSAGGY